jgi:two-component system nitrogen regulation sensor histidine kinase GlnL
VSASRPVTPTRPAERFGWPDVLASLSDGVLVLDADGIVDDCNPAAELLAGISASQVIGRSVLYAFGTRATNRWVVELVEATLRGAVTHRRSEESLWSSGRDVAVSAACAPVLDASGTLRGAVLVLHDLTLQRAIETASRQAERLAALDGVAAGLAHEIRNPLGGIKGAAQLLRTGLSDPEQLRCTDLIIREVERLAGLVDQLRDLGSRRRSPCNRSTSIASSVTCSTWSSRRPVGVRSRSWPNSIRACRLSSAIPRSSTRRS